MTEDGTATLCNGGLMNDGTHCTGSAHIDGLVIRCTDPAHTVTLASLPRPTFVDLLNDPTQQLDTEGIVLTQVLNEQERDHLRSEGWRACVDHIRRNYDGWLSPEDIYWTGRKNPFRAAPPTPPADQGNNHTKDGAQ